MKVIILALSILLVTCTSGNERSQQNKNNGGENMEFPVQKSEQEWKQELTEAEYQVLRKKGTERPYTGEYNDHYDAGTYVCKACGAELFTSETKFESHCGWPSFYNAIDKKNIKEVPDNSHGMKRIEVVCANCGGHLGHVFDDGPDPTGLRYCINSVSLGFEPKKEHQKKKESGNEE